MEDDDHFSRLTRSPRQWQDHARGLVWAANRLRRIIERRVRLGFGRRGLSETEALHQRHHSSRAVILLYSFAVENMLKAIWLARGYDPIGPGGSLKREFAHHKLVKLASSAKVAGLNSTVLLQVTDFIESGRFPAGKDAARGLAAQRYFGDSVVRSLEELLTQLEAELAATGHSELAKATKLTLLGLRPRRSISKIARRRTRG